VREEKLSTTLQSCQG